MVWCDVLDVLCVCGCVLCFVVSFIVLSLLVLYCIDCVVVEVWLVCCVMLCSASVLLCYALCLVCVLLWCCVLI